MTGKLISDYLTLLFQRLANGTVFTHGH